MHSGISDNVFCIEKLAINWLDRDFCATSIVDGSLRLLWSNRPMTIMLQSYKHILLSNGCVAANPAENQDRLVNFVQECSSSLSTLLLPDRMAGHLIFQGRLIGRSEGRHFVGLQIRHTADFKPHYIDLDAAFGLTKMEHRVLLQMLDGRIADEISSADGTSIGTVRTHIRHIYEKMQVTSREGLFYAASPYRL